MNVNEIERIIKTAAEQSKISSPAEWTKKLNEGFISFGHGQKLSVYCKTDGGDWGEWLYDLTICEQEAEYILSTKLVMESEWHKDDQSIWEDFQKLLLCNSEYKVMVFYQNKEIIPDLKKQIEKYNNTNGTFILACYTDDNGYVFEIVKKE